METEKTKEDLEKRVETLTDCFNKAQEYITELEGKLKDVVAVIQRKA